MGKKLGIGRRAKVGRRELGVGSWQEKRGELGLETKQGNRGSQMANLKFQGGNYSGDSLAALLTTDFTMYTDENDCC